MIRTPAERHRADGTWSTLHLQVGADHEQIVSDGGRVLRGRADMR
ncbi:hypothetical protein [Streptomyces sp. NPDC051776]